jgi:hypothetical protein
MKIRIFNHKTGEDILTASSKLDVVIMDAYNNVMVELIKKHGDGFRVLTSGPVNGVIAVDFTNDIRAIIDPEKEQS